MKTSKFAFEIYWPLALVHSIVWAELSVQCMLHSMTSLLTYTVAHSTRPSYSPKVDNQPLKKFLSLVVSWVNDVKMAKFWLSKSIFYVKKYPNLSKQNFHWRIWFQGHTFCYWHFLKTSIFKPLYFLKWRPIFDDFCSTERKT